MNDKNERINPPENSKFKDIFLSRDQNHSFHTKLGTSEEIILVAGWLRMLHLSHHTFPQENVKLYKSSFRE
jgi:hypothetical protein